MIVLGLLVLWCLLMVIGLGCSGLLKAWFWGGRFCWFFGDSFCRVCVAWFGLGFGVWVWLWWLLRWVGCLVLY